MSENVLEQCVLELFKIGVVKFGSFTLKSGMQSPVYFDLRMIISYPSVMETVADLIWKARPRSDYQLMCGVAYTGLPIATLISAKQNLPMVLRRKEAKGYGTKKMVEGNYKEGQNCLIVEDVIVSGGSLYETVETLIEIGLEVHDAVVFLDREHGGYNNLGALGVNVFPVLTMAELMRILLKHKQVSQDTHNTVLAHIASNRNTSIIKKEKSASRQGVGVMDRKNCSFESRMEITNHPLARRLLQIMTSKRTNLCLAADVTSAHQLLSFANQLGPHICLLKTHVDLLDDFTADVAQQLSDLSEKHNFLLFEDRKYGDIGSTVAQQYSGGAHRVVEWAHLVTAHALPGPGIIKGLTSAVGDRERGCVLVSQMSSEGALTSQEYIKGCNSLAANHTHFVIGFVSQSSVSDDPRFLLLTPGVKLAGAGDGLGQQYVSPRAAVLERSADVVIVGRGITEAEDLVSAAITYKEHAFSAYEERVAASSS